MSVVGVGILIFTAAVIILAFPYLYRKRKESDRKDCGGVLGWLRGEGRRDVEDAADVPHQGERRAATPLLPADACSSAVIPLRSDDIVRNPIYFTQPEIPHLNAAGA